MKILEQSTGPSGLARFSHPSMEEFVVDGSRYGTTVHLGRRPRSLDMLAVDAAIVNFLR